MTNKKNRSAASLQLGKPVMIMNYAILILFAILIIIPLLTILNTSFKTGIEYLESSSFMPPKAPTLDNYKLAFGSGGILIAYKNTLILMISGVIGSVLMGLGASYVLNRFNFKSKKLIVNMFLFALAIPSATIQVSIFPVIRDLGLYNTLGACILLYVSTDVLQLYIFLQYMEKIPVALDESARVDGCNYFRILFQIIVPQLTPAIVTVSLIKGIAIYNDMLIQVLYMSKLSLRTVSTALTKFFYLKNMQWPVMMSAIILAMIPTILIYAFAQKAIISGAMSGSVKE